MGPQFFLMALKFVQGVPHMSEFPFSSFLMGWEGDEILIFGRDY